MEVLMLNGPDPRLFVHAVPVYVTVGVETETDHHVAAIKLQYKLDELICISPVLLEMKKRGISPTVFVWDEEREVAQVSSCSLWMRQAQN
ncbi:MAG: hypothetical protein WDN10_01260 [bacterium]